VSRHDDPSRPSRLTPPLPGGSQADPDDGRVAGFLQAVIRTAAEGICVCAPCPHFPFLRFSVWNDRMTELTGYTMEEINRLGWYQTVYPGPAVRDRAVERMARMRDGDDLRQEEWTVTRKDGTERVLAMSTSRIETDTGPAVVALMTDVTERERAEAALRRSEARLAMAQQIARLGSWEWDIRSGAVWWSDELYRLFAQDPATFRPSLEAFMALVHPGDRELVRDHLERSVRDGASYQYECRIVRPDGSMWWKRAEGVVERDPSGRAVRAWGTCQDVTERRRAAEARRLEAVGVLAGGIAHEFNNLLTAVLGHAEMAEMEMPAAGPGRRHLGPIREAAGRATELCRQMLAYAGKGRLVVGAVDLGQVVREAAEAVGPAPPVRQKLAPDVPTVRGDPEQLRQLAANLLANATEAVAGTAGRVGVAIRRTRLEAPAAARLRHTPGLPAGEYVVLEVQDEGPGMDELTLGRAFEPFFSTKFPGRGLGLPVVLGVVRAHGGGLEVDSQPGRGTTVRVYLPAG
jgi:two-component system, cell cycle sensor histidine kinase and response regulator CckA